VTADQRLRLVVARHEAERYPESVETLDVAALNLENAILRAEVTRLRKAERDLINRHIWRDTAFSVAWEIIKCEEIQAVMTDWQYRGYCRIRDGLKEEEGDCAR
jgi:hypothetical protein